MSDNANMLSGRAQIDSRFGWQYWLASALVFAATATSDGGTGYRPCRGGRGTTGDNGGQRGQPDGRTDVAVVTLTVTGVAPPGPTPAKVAAMDNPSDPVPPAIVPAQAEVSDLPPDEPAAAPIASETEIWAGHFESEPTLPNSPPTEKAMAAG